MKVAEENQGPEEKRQYQKPRMKAISLNDDTAVDEFCEGKPFDAAQLKRFVEETIEENSPKQGDLSLTRDPVQRMASK